MEKRFITFVGMSDAAFESLKKAAERYEIEFCDVFYSSLTKEKAEHIFEWLNKNQIVYGQHTVEYDSDYRVFLDKIYEILDNRHSQHLIFDLTGINKTLMILLLLEIVRLEASKKRKKNGRNEIKHISFVYYSLELQDQILLPFSFMLCDVLGRRGAEKKIIELLADDRVSSVTKLASTYGSSKSFVSNRIAEFEDLGLVERIPTNRRCNGYDLRLCPGAQIYAEYKKYLHSKKVRQR